jgi:plastocyanin
MRTLRALAVVLLLVVGVAACGSDDGGNVASSGSSSTSGPGSDAYGAGGADAGGAQAGAAVDIKDLSFSPKVLEVKAGDEVTITNDDSTEHTFTLDDGSFDSGHIKAGSSTKHTFAEAGTFSYHCEIHPSMKGTIEVS